MRGLQSLRDLFLVLLTGGFWALIIVQPSLGGGLMLAGSGLCFILYVLSGVLQGIVERTILSWAMIFPLGYYFLSFPRDKAVITLDRVLPLILLPTMIMTSREAVQQIPKEIWRCAAAWAMFLVVAAVSLRSGGDLLTSGRLLIEGFCIPPLLGWCVLRNFNVRRYAGGLHTAACVMALYVVVIGAIEMITREDILPLPGSSLYFAGSLTRPNGPFYTDDSFALIGLVTFFLLLFLRNVLGEEVSVPRRILHGFGAGAALLTSLMPMFRSVLVSLMLVLLVEIFTTRKASHRVAAATLMVTTVLVLSAIKVLAPDAYEDRSKPDNFYVRLAEQMQTMQVVLSKPLLGVGLGRFKDVVSRDSRYMALYEGVQSIDSPHNNIGAILSETGILGLFPYVAAQFFFVSAFWKLRTRGTQDVQFVWRYFLYIFVSYSVNGLTLATGYNSDVNLWLMLATCVLYKYGLTERIGAIQNPALAPRYAA